MVHTSRTRANYNYSYNLNGIIHQFGNTAIHKTGQRSECAKINILFNIRESDAIGSEAFIKWIKIFNLKISQIAIKYNCKVISYQDFIESQK